MKTRTPSAICSIARAAFAALVVGLPATFAQETVPAEVPGSTSDSTSTETEIVTLSPFEVTTEKDQGYRATNSISGSRINTPIKEIPMPIEVITDDFVQDVGASDLRQSLRYSAGVILQSQNDQGSNQFYGAGGVHNPEGATANKSQSTFKIRGYITDVVLRDGYRRQSSTDSINIGRIEIIRGPAALLYGIGNFGGIVNYLPKTPEREQQTALRTVYGSHDFMRFSVDTTGPLDREDGKMAYRLTGAWQDTGNHTELYSEDHWFISPSFNWRPTLKTNILIDAEFGEQHEDALGFQSVRARSDIDGIGQADRLQSSGFVQFAGKDPRTFRWSGPDTFRNSDQANFRAQITQEIFPKFNVLAGYNRSRVKFDARDVNGSMRQNVGPLALRDTITVIPIDVVNGSSEFQQSETSNTIFEYLWTDSAENNSREQARIEANYAFELFADSKWFGIDSSILAGRSIEDAKRTTTLNRSANNTFNYKRPTDTSYIRFGTQGDGTPDVAMVDVNWIRSNASNTGDYLVYQGKFVDDRVTVVAGVRRDKNDNDVTTRIFHPSASDTFAERPSQRETTEQYGATLQLTRELSIYGLKAGGVQPNFDGLRDAAGDPLGPVTAESNEFGVKIDLFNGKVSGTISKFKIKRSGVPFGQWWMPTLKDTFDPNRPIIYNVGNFSPSTVTGGSNGGNGAADAALPEWNAGVTAGSIYQLDVNGTPNWYVNATQPAGAAYLDRVFNLTKTTNPGWPGWLYIADANTNNSWEDRGGGNGYQSYVQQEDEADGWDTQILFSPTENLQFVVSYAHTKRVITNPGSFIRYPHPENRWAIWYFPDSNWGLTGYDLDEVYTDPTDTSTWTGIGWGAGQSRDDTPKHAISGWMSYRVTGETLKGLTLGFGGQWESEREYFSGITVAGQKQTNGAGQLTILRTEPRLNLDMMVRYPFTLQERNAYLQLNVTNLLDDTDLYGLIYAPGRSMRLEFGYDF